MNMQKTAGYLQLQRLSSLYEFRISNSSTSNEDRLLQLVISLVEALESILSCGEEIRDFKSTDESQNVANSIMLVEIIINFVHTLHRN